MVTVDGKYEILDGQFRYAVLKAAGWSDFDIKREFPDYDKLREEHANGGDVPGGAYS